MKWQSVGETMDALVAILFGGVVGLALGLIVAWVVDAL